MKLSTSILGLFAVGTASVLMGGCCNCGNQHGLNGCADTPRGALPEPLGAHVHRFEDAQTKNAEAAQFVIYANGWYMGGKVLGPYGEYHIQQIIKHLPSVPSMVCIQPTLDSELNQERRRVVLTRLLAAGIGDAELRVKIEYPQTEGLAGDEAARVYGRMVAHQN